jgi:hypothetical protein
MPLSLKTGPFLLGHFRPQNGRSFPYYSWLAVLHCQMKRCRGSSRYVNVKGFRVGQEVHIV